MATRKKAARKKRSAAKKKTPAAKKAPVRGGPHGHGSETASVGPVAKRAGRGDGSKSKIVRLMRKFERDAKEKENFHMSVSDYLRLLQMKRELDDQPGNVEVRWVETPDEEQKSGE
jgi:hypothetical protein